MAKGLQITAFESGELRVLASEEGGREAVLALSLSRLLLKMVRVPNDEDPVEVAMPILKSLSPFPDDPLAVSCETVRESASGKIVIAAALPEGVTDDIANALDAAKLNVVRVDALALGALRGLWGDIGTGLEGGEEKRRLLVLRSPDCTTLVVLDGDAPASIRAVADESDISREKTLSLLEAEDFNGPKELSETIERDIDIDAALAGTRERTEESGTLNALPDSWRDVLTEARFKAKLVKNLAIAVGVWLLAMAVLFGVPVVYGFMTDRVKGLCREHAREYKAVAEKKAKVKLVQQYSDHARGALEIMKAVSDQLPSGLTLTSWDFSRDDGLRLRGESEDGSAPVYKFKDALVEMGGDEPVFKVVNLGSMSSQRGGKQRFDLDCRYEEVEE